MHTMSVRHEAMFPCHRIVADRPISDSETTIDGGSRRPTCPWQDLLKLEYFAQRVRLLTKKIATCSLFFYSFGPRVPPTGPWFGVATPISDRRAFTQRKRREGNGGLLIIHRPLLWPGTLFASGAIKTKGVQASPSREQH